MCATGRWQARSAEPYCGDVATNHCERCRPGHGAGVDTVGPIGPTGALVAPARTGCNRPRSMEPQAAIDASARAFTARYEQLAPALCVWAMRHVSRTVQARIEVDDVLQETWLRAFRLRDRFQGDDAAFRSWMFAIAKNLLLEVQRSARRIQRVQLADGRTSNVLAFDQISASVTALSQALVRDDAIRRFHAHLQTLPRADQDLVSYCGLEGSTCAEAARKLGIGVEATHKRWQRLRERLHAEGLAHDWLT